MEDTGRAVDPAVLKFTGIKVHVSQLTSRHHSKAVVISNGTSAHDVVKMVAKKLRMEQKQTSLMCLLAEIYRPDPQRGKAVYKEVVLRDEDAPLVLYDGHPRGAVRFHLVWKEKAGKTRSNHPTQESVHHRGDHNSHSQAASRGKDANYHNGSGSPRSSPRSQARDTMERLESKLTKYNGCTLPGGGIQKPTMSRDHKGQSHREDFLIHYEPYTAGNDGQAMSRNGHVLHNNVKKNVSPHTSLPVKFDRDAAQNRRRSWDPSMFKKASEATQSKEVNNNYDFCKPDPVHVTRLEGLQVHPRLAQEEALKTSTPKFVSSNSAFSPPSCRTLSTYDVTGNAIQSSETSSAGSANSSFRVDSADLRNSSLPNIGEMEIHEKLKRNKVVHSNSFTSLRADKKRIRNLPTLKATQEIVEEKRRSITDLFSNKLRKFLNERRHSLQSNKSSLLSGSFDTSNITSGSVSHSPSQDIPVKGYDPVADRDDTMSVTSMEVADILAGAPPPAPSDEEDENYDNGHQSDSTIERDTPPVDEAKFVPMKFAEGPSTKETIHLQDAPKVKEKSMKAAKKADNLDNFVEQSMKSFISHAKSPKKHSKQSKGQPSPAEKGTDGSTSQVPKRVINLFTILRTHKVNAVSVLKQRRKDTLNISVHHVTVELANGVTDYNGWSAQTRRTQHIKLPAIKSAQTNSSIFIVGELRLGDLLIEVNGNDCTFMSSEDIERIFQDSDVIKMVVARPRAAVHTGTDP